ncbi:hypothetical protein MBLNU13_g09040t1 [Cladosporium sp. NU13]
MVPTARALNQSIVITLICVWELYEAIELCDNQGTCPDRNSSVICRRKTPSEAQDCLFVVKEQRWSGGAIPRHVVKPRSPYIVDLHSAFFQDGTVWTIYEEMDLSLEQIFELDCDPWTVDPGRKDLQISAISAQVCFSTARFAHSLINQQVLRGLVYIHDNLGVAHGAISARNVLLKRTGRVKLANVGICLLTRAVAEISDDSKAFAELLARLFAPDMPVKAVLRRCLSDCAFDFYQCVSQSSPNVALEGGAVAWSNSTLDSAMEGPDPVPADAASAVIDFTHRIHQALVGIYGEEAERILLNFRDELHAQIEKNSQVESACRDGLQLAISTHVPVGAGHARLLQGLIEARNLDNASAGAGRRESQAAATFKRSDERLQAIARINVAWGKDILQHYKFDEIGRTTAVCLAQVAQLYPDWSRAVQRMNAAMLSRHISSITDNGQRIGDHHSTSNVKDRNRPLEAVDAKLVVEWRRQGIVELTGVRVADVGNDLPQEPQRAIDEWTTCETVPLAFQSTQRSLNQFDGLHKDRYGLLVPRSSAIHQKRKRSGRSGADKTKRTQPRGVLETRLRLSALIQEIWKIPSLWKPQSKASGPVILKMTAASSLAKQMPPLPAAHHAV